MRVFITSSGHVTNDAGTPATKPAIRSSNGPNLPAHRDQPTGRRSRGQASDLRPRQKQRQRQRQRAVRSWSTSQRNVSTQVLRECLLDGAGSHQELRIHQAPGVYGSMQVCASPASASLSALILGSLALASLIFESRINFLRQHVWQHGRA